MTDAPHFYTVGGTLPPTARSYVTRHADETLLTHLLRGDFCYVLTSRQMGKSSLMVRTAGALRENGVAVAILDLTRLGQNLTPEQWYDGLLVRLGVELKLVDELEDYWVHDRVSRLGPMQRFIGALREVLLPSRKGNFVIFIDEIDSVRSLPFSSDEFFAGIREMYNGRVNDPELERISFCLLGVAQPSDLISNVNITPFNIGHRIELTDFTEAEAQPLLQGLQGSQGSAGRQTTNAVILRRILYWTGGHPYLTQRLFEAIAGSMQTVSRADVDMACEELFLSSRSREKEDNLLFVRDRVLAEKEDRSSVLDLYAKVLRGKKIKDDDANPIIDVLRLSGIVSVSDGYLSVRNRIYATVFNQDWVIANMPDAELRRQKAAYRRGLAFAASIGLVVLTIVAILGTIAYRSGESELREHYFADIGAAQQAFENGDMKTGDAILDEWQLKKPHRWWKRPQYWWREYAYDRPTLLNRFSFKLLEEEKDGSDSGLLPEGSNSKVPHKFTGCGEFRAVASTVRDDGKKMVAAAGTDSVVYLWDTTDTQHPRPFAALELESNNNGLRSIPVSTNRPPCNKIHGPTGPGIMSLSFSPDGRRLAISSGSWGNQEANGHVLLWNMEDNPAIDLHAGFTGAADSNMFSSDGKFLVASGEDDTAELWQLPVSGQPGDPTIFDPRRQSESRAGSTNNLFEAAIETGTADVRQIVGNGANAVALSSPARHLMALGYGDGHLVIYDYRLPNAPLFNQIVHVSGIMSLLFIDDKNLAVGTRDGDLLIFNPDDLISDARTGKAAKPFRALPTAQGILQAIAISPDRKWLATSGSNGAILLWRWPDGNRPAIFRGHQGRVYSVAFCQPADARCLISGSQDKDVRLWNLPLVIPSEERAKGKGDVREGDATPHRLLVHGQAIGLAYLRDGTVVAGVGTTTQENYDHSGDIVFWHPGAKLEPPINVDDRAPIVGFAVSPDGKFVVTSSRTRNLVLLGIQDKKLPKPLFHADITLSSISIASIPAIQGSPGSCCEYLIAGIVDPRDPRTKSRKPVTGLCLWRVLDNGPVSSDRFRITPDKVTPCSRNRGERDLPTSSPTFQQLLSKVTAMAFSKDGTQVATALIQNNKTYVYIWNTSDLMNGRLTYERSNPFPDQFYRMAFSPDGKYLGGTTVTSGFYYWPSKNTGTVPPLDQQGREKLGYYVVPLPSRGMTLAFSPVSPVLAIGLEDSRILLWSTEDHRVTMQIHRHSGGVQALAFSHRGNKLASAGNDGRIVLLQDQ